MIGRVVSHYKVLERLGRGGMGVVYKAEDIKLGRKVALKFLPPHVSPTVETNQRFLQEARAASALDHPNTCTIFEIDETEEGQLFIVMAYYDGETLSAKLKQGSLPASEAAGFVSQAALGLGRAHQQGIIHRDVKPANLMVTREGVVKVLDFGIAKLVGGSPVTHAGKIVGSVEYMAPEHARGDDIDARADLWSLGVVLYEALSGKKPFRSDHPQAALYAILHLEPKPLCDVAPYVPGRLQEVVAKALQKAPALRYQNAEELIRDLDEQESWTGPTSAYPSQTPVRPQPSIAVLSFKDMSPEQDQQYFCDGMAEELITSLSRVEGLRVASRTSTFELTKGGPTDLRTVRERLGVSTILEGSVRKAGLRLRITVRLVNATDGYELWSDQYDRELEDIFAVQEEIARQIVETLRPKLLAEVGPLVQPAGGFEAYNLYLKGRFHWNQRTEAGLKKSIELFEQAAAADPTYARAYAGLADAHLLLGIYGFAAPDEVMPRAREAAEKALGLDGQSAEVYASLACLEAVYEWDWEGAEGDFRHAIVIDPRYPTAHHWFAANVLAPCGRFKEALDELRLAEDLDPLSLAIHASVGLVFTYERRFEEAIDELQRAIELDPRFAVAHFFHGQALSQLGRHDEAIAALERAVQLSEGALEIRSALACAYAAAGKVEPARRIRRELEERSLHGYVSPVLLAQIHASLGEVGSALDLLARAIRWRAADLAWVGVRPVFDALRGEPRFGELLEDLHLRAHAAASSFSSSREDPGEDDLTPTRIL
ncbi:MAG TPA: protein kinase [Thermoanaerobaculia bacterium]|nr:protein kinase [Thermoanaerobaculia bacterium]